RTADTARNVHVASVCVFFAGNSARVGSGERVLRLEVDDRVRRARVCVVENVLLELDLGLRQQDAVLRALGACDRGNNGSEVELKIFAERGLNGRVVPERLLLGIRLNECDGLLVATRQAQVVERDVVD